MGDGELTLAILREIRDEIRKTNTRLDATNGRLDGTNERLDATNERLDRVVHEQIRHSTAIVELEAGQREIVTVLKGMAHAIEGLNMRLDNVLLGPLGDKVRNLDSRMQRVEGRLGIEQGT